MDKKSTVDKDLIPPRLNEPYLIWGFTVIELIISLVMILIICVSFKFELLIIPAFYIVTSARIIDGINARDYVKVLINYYCKPQSFSQIGGEDNE